VLTGPGESLKTAMADPRADIPSPPNLSEEFLKDLTLDRYVPQPIQFAGVTSGPSPIAITEGASTIDFRADKPTPPPAQIVKLASGRSFADVNAGGAQQVAATDLAEVRVDFTIPSEAIADAFRRARLPADQQNTSVLRVTLMRQRLLADGSWGEETEVPLLSNNPLASQFPLPDEDAPVETKQAYAAFAEQNPQWVLQPPFYEVRAGDNPMDLQVVVEVPSGDEAARPAAGEAEGEDPATQDSGDESQTNFNYQDREADERGGADAGLNQPPPQQDVRRQPGQARNQPDQDAEAPAAAPLPPGAFNAAQLGAPISGWAWDTDAVPGETYRYKVVYSLKNPLFGTSGVATDPNLETVLVLPSEPPAEWSPEITVEPLTYYYMTETGSQQATFTVFRWQNGGWQAEKFRVSPGDYIGLPSEAGGIDYRTGQTLVDVREDPTRRESFALLVDDQGRFTRRTIRDVTDPKHKELQELLNAPPAEEEEGVARGD
jgi:hypothetical protein